MTRLVEAVNRPGYDGVNASEYCDEDDVLDEKVQSLVRLIKRSEKCVIYSGAGISVSSGIPDYATHSSKSKKEKSSSLARELLQSKEGSFHVKTNACTSSPCFHV
jgi:hypothetical protein